ncbi:hypothetical protein JCM18382A_50040 [Bradyrhizobium sp. 17-4]
MVLRIALEIAERVRPIVGTQIEHLLGLLADLQAEASGGKASRVLEGEVDIGARHGVL